MQGSRPLRVTLVSTAATGVPGSMRAYADVLLDALSSHAPDIDVRIVELDPVPVRSGLGNKFATLALPWRARRQRSLEPDVWHVLDGSRAYVAAGLCNAPVVITAHDIIPHLQQQGRFADAPAQGFAARWLWRRNLAALRASRGVVCVSESTRRDLHAEGVQPGCTSVVPLPVRPALLALDGDAARPVREAGTVLHVGNNAFYKARDQVLRIFARADRTVARRLVMIGPEPAAGMRALAVELGLANAVEWVENADDAILAEHYRRAAVMVFPSQYEGFGWPVLEAMALGLPVVASNAGSLPEVIGGVAPCVAPDDIEGFVREIEAILLDPALAARRAAAGRVRAQDFSMQTLASGTAAAYAAAGGTLVPS